MTNPENNQVQEEKKVQKQAHEIIKKFDEYLEASPLRGLLKEMDAFFNKSILQHFPVNIYETENEVVVKAEIPGVLKEQIFMDINGSFLTIEIKHIQVEQGNNEINSFYKKEISSGKTARTITLPSPVDEKQAKASYRNGILEIRAPKRPLGLNAIEIVD